MNRILKLTGNFLQPFFLLCVRVFWGWEFLWTGMGKFADISQITTYFSSLGIPFPLVNAYAAASVEVVGGAFLIVGFASRLVSLPLIATMVVALVTAHHDATLAIWDDPVNFISQLPFTFFFAALIIFVFGPGSLSVDRLTHHE